MCRRHATKKETTLLPRMSIIYEYTDMSSCFHNLILFLFEKSIRIRLIGKRKPFHYKFNLFMTHENKAHVHIHKKKVNLNKCKHTHHKRSSHCKTLRFIKNERKRYACGNLIHTFTDIYDQLCSL